MANVNPNLNNRKHRVARRRREELRLSEGAPVKAPRVRSRRAVAKAAAASVPAE